MRASEWNMAETLGVTLKKIRDSKHLSLEEISDKTRISKKIIMAIEGDRLNEISSPFYARNFVKSYAQFLGATEEKIVKEYLTGGETKKDESVLTLKREVALGENILKHKEKIVSFLVVVFAIWLVLFSFTQLRKFVRNSSLKRKARVVENKKAEPEKISSEEQDQTVESWVEEKEGLKLEIAARSDTWLHVIGDGQLLFRGVLNKKEKDVWRVDKELKIELGNAAGVTLTLNDKDIGPLGKKGEKKTIVITKDGVE